ncbi:telomere-protecting terminal protein Tpg [Streptomyces cinereoruber]|uniref:telomere-protecting terminal protein Tpg n=1 Tax=Streptomyces cinereoruber TaxID=67260 RepID=UPI003C2DAD7C
MGKLLDAMRSRFLTKDLPKTAKGQFNALMRKEDGNTARVAERLGVSRRTVQRYVSGERSIAKTKPEILDRLQQEVSKDHQPRVTARAVKEAQRKGMTIETRAAFGFSSAAGSTDDPRMRRLTEDVPDHLIPEIFEAMRNGDEDRLNELLGQGLAEEYFRTSGPDAENLDVEFSDIDYVELDFR